MKYAILITALSAAACGGTFFAFSTFVMRALDRLGPSEAAGAMRSINVAAITPLFMLLLFGPGLAMAVIAVQALATPGSGWSIVAAALAYWVGCIAVTIGRNVPLNNVLAVSQAADAWSQYYGPWIYWNHARTLACLASALLLGVGLLM